MGDLFVNQQPNLRRINGIISALLLCVFLVHATLGSISLLYPIPRSFGFLIWGGVGLVVIHVILCIATSKDMLTDTKRPPSNKKKDHLVLKWVSGALLIPAVVLHLSGFGNSLETGYTSFYLALIFLLIVFIASHEYVGIKSLLKDLDIDRRYRLPICLTICLLGVILAITILGQIFL